MKKKKSTEEPKTVVESAKEVTKPVEKVNKPPKLNFAQQMVQKAHKDHGDTILPTTMDMKVPIFWHIFNKIATVELGSIAEVYGPFSCGKSLLMMIIAGAFQKMGGNFICFNTEAANRDKGHLEKVCPGLVYDDIGFMQPETIETLFTVIQDIVAETKIDDAPLMIGIDSISSTSSKHEMEAGMEKADLTLAKMISKGLRMVNNPLSKKPIYLYMVSQLRSKINTYGSAGSVGAGGRAPEYYSSLIIEMFCKDTFYADNTKLTPIGHNGELLIKKSRYSLSGTRIPFEFYGETGIPEYSGLIDYLIAKKIVEQKGSWLTYCGENFQRKNFDEFSKKHLELLELAK